MPLVLVRRRGESIEYMVPPSLTPTRIVATVVAIQGNSKVKLISDCPKSVAIRRLGEPNDDPVGIREERE